MLTNNAYTTTEMQWPNLFNTYQFLKRTDATTADEKIISYLDQQVQKAVESGFATEAELKKRLRTNLVADKKVKFRGQMDKLYLVSLFDEYTKPTGADVRQQYRATASTVKLSKSKWQYTVEELKQLDGDEDFWRSIYNNIASVQSKKPEAFAQYFGTNGYMIAMDAKDYARQRAAACKNKTEVIPTVPVNLSLEEKIAKGIPVVITPDVVRELIKLYPNVTATDTTFGKSDAEAIEADKAAKAAELAAIKEAEAKEKAEAKAERERLAAEARAKRAEAEAKRVEEAKAAAEKAAKRKAIEDALRAKMAEAKAAKTATTTTEDEGSTDPSPEDKNFDISGDLWAEAVDEENNKPEIIVPEPSPEMIIWQRAQKLKDAIEATGENMIHGYEIDVEFGKDLDEVIEEVCNKYPDNFEYNEDLDELWFFPDEN
jgi:hypothetical protein